MKHHRTPSARVLFLSLLLVTGLATVLAPLRAQEPAADEKLQQRFDQARQKYQAGDYQGVVTLLEPLKMDSTSPAPMLSLYGGALIELGRFQDAQLLLDPVAASDAAGPALLFNAARAAFAMKQDVKGEGFLVRALEKAPGSMAARALGLRYGRQGKFAEAYKLLQPWAAAHPDDGDVLLAAAFCAVELGRSAEADGFASSLNGLAVQLIQQGKKDEARQLLNQILSLRPDNAAARASLQSLGG